VAASSGMAFLLSCPSGMASLLPGSSGTAVSSGSVSSILASSPADSTSVETGSAGVEVSALSSAAEESVPASTFRVSGFSPSSPVSSASGTFSVSMSFSWRMFSSVTTVSSVFVFLGIVSSPFCYFAASKIGRWITSGHDGFFVRHYNFAVLALGRSGGWGARCFRIRLPCSGLFRGRILSGSLRFGFRCHQL
jgi:hypothetical protein